jgi:hypothetical protein
MRCALSGSSGFTVALHVQAGSQKLVEKNVATITTLDDVPHSVAGNRMLIVSIRGRVTVGVNETYAICAPVVST